MSRRKETIVRYLCEQEIAEAHKVFGDMIAYDMPRIISARHILALRRHQILTPRGDIFWPDATANLADLTDTPTLATFIHEMAHVMQFQRGLSVLARGCLIHGARLLTLSRYDPYRYWFEHGKAFLSYNIEQQAEIAIGIYFGWYPNIIRCK